MRQKELRNSVSFCPRFGSLIIPIDPFKSKYVPSERISKESEGNIGVMVFLAGDLRPGRYAPCTSPPLTCYANHANSLVCTTVIKRSYVLRFHSVVKQLSILFYAGRGIVVLDTMLVCVCSL